MSSSASVLEQLKATAERLRQEADALPADDPEAVTAYLARLKAIAVLLHIRLNTRGSGG